MEKTERNARILQLRNEGKTFKEIASLEGLSVARVRIIASEMRCRLEREKVMPKWAEGLNPTVFSKLKPYDYKNKQQVVDDIRNKKLAPNIPNFGWMAFLEIFKWSGLSDPRLEKIYGAVSVLKSQGLAISLKDK